MMYFLLKFSDIQNNNTKLFPPRTIQSISQHVHEMYACMLSPSHAIFFKVFFRRSVSPTPREIQCLPCKGFLIRSKTSALNFMCPSTQLNQYMCTNLLILFFLQTGTGRGDPKQSKSFKAQFLAIFFIVDGRLVVDHFFFNKNLRYNLSISQYSL